MKYVALLTLAAGCLWSQEAAKTDLLKLNEQLQAAIDVHEWGKAADLSHSLNTAVRDARDRSMSADSEKLAQTILGGMPADTETFIVAQRPFGVVEPKEDSPSALDMARGYMLGLLEAAEEERIPKATAGETIRLAALGARIFSEQRPYDNGAIPLGLIAYQGCAVYAFVQPVAEATYSRNADESILGHRVWVSKGTQNDRRASDTYYVTFPKPDTFVVCNDRSFLTDLLTRMAAPATPRALPASLPEWKLVDRSAPLWAIRHFRADRASVDPSNPAHLLSPDRDPEATGIAVHFGLASAAASAVMFAKSDPWGSIGNAHEFHGLAHSRKIAEGVWEFSVTGQRESAMMAAFVLMAALGFVVYI